VTTDEDMPLLMVTNEPHEGKSSYSIPGPTKRCSACNQECTSWIGQGGDSEIRVCFNCLIHAAIVCRQLVPGQVQVDTKVLLESTYPDVESEPNPHNLE